MKNWHGFIVMFFSATCNYRCCTVENKLYHML